MEHYVLLQFQPEHFDEELWEITVNTYQELQRQVQGIHQVKVSKNIFLRDKNADLMIHLKLENFEALQRYLQHPIHLGYVERTKPYVRQQISFDC